LHPILLLPSLSLSLSLPKLKKWLPSFHPHYHQEEEEEDSN
jgi:hypothetical protein